MKLPLTPGCVVLLDMKTRTPTSILAAHTDSVRVLCALPDGLLTCGGKKDATVRLWADDCLHDVNGNEIDDIESHINSLQLSDRVYEPPVKVVPADNSRVLQEPGYIFDACVLLDQKPGSNLYALASARYNIVKICL